MKRKLFQGVTNVLRFNRHFYLIAGLILVTVIYFYFELPQVLQPYIFWLGILFSFQVVLSLLISFYIYDVSDLYELEWIPNVDNRKFLNVNAGFDEVSDIIESKFANVDLSICDFYNAEKHTELSIKRARKAYPPKDKTISVNTHALPYQDNSFDFVLAMLSAHEIRDENERIQFFKELYRVAKLNSEIYVTEHLRDTNNFIAYTLGFFHFHSKATWLKTFGAANLAIKRQLKVTPFITIFILTKHGSSL